MNNKALFVLLGMAVLSTTGARLLGVWNGSQPYVNRLLGSARVVRFLAQHHADILAEFQKLSDLQKAA